MGFENRFQKVCDTVKFLISFLFSLTFFFVRFGHIEIDSIYSGYDTYGLLYVASMKVKPKYQCYILRVRVRDLNK